MDEAENQINNLEHKEEKQSDQQEEKRIPKNKGRLWCLWDIFKSTNIRITGMPEWEDKE